MRVNKFIDNTGSDEDDLIDDEQYPYISPYGGASRSPMNDSPSLVKPEEIIIVGGVLILWISVIALFIHKWGKIRGLEPYIPHFDRTSLHTHPSTGGAVVTTNPSNQVTGVTVQTATSIYSSAAINDPSSSTAAAAATIGQVSVESGVKSYSEVINTAGDTSDASQVSHETAKRYNNIHSTRVSNKMRVNLSNKPRKTTGKDKWLQPYTQQSSDWSSSGHNNKFKCRVIKETKQLSVNKNIIRVGVKDEITSHNNLHTEQQMYRRKKINVHHDNSCVSEEANISSNNIANTVKESSLMNDNLSINSGHSIDVSRRKREEKARRKRSREYFYPYSSRRPRASIDSSSITANHVAQFSLNSPLVSNERLLQSHAVDFHQSPYLKHKQNVNLTRDQIKFTQSMQFNDLHGKHYQPVHRWKGEHFSNQFDQVTQSERKTLSDKTSGDEIKNIQLNIDDDDDDNVSVQLNVNPFVSNGYKRCPLKAKEEILYEDRSYIDMPSLVLLRMAQSEPNIAETRHDS